MKQTFKKTTPDVATKKHKMNTSFTDMEFKLAQKRQS